MMKKKGFTLLEAVVSMFIVTVGVGAVFVLINQTLNSNRIISSKFTAIYLAQEGVELAREVRDSNFLKIHKGISGVNWDAGIVSSDWQPVVFVDGTQGNFQRKTIITPEGSDILKVSVEVFWQEQGRAHSVTVQENLYNWLE